MGLIYVLGDGDRVQSMLDKALLTGTLEDVASISSKITAAMNAITSAVNGKDGWRIVFAGGDDICLVAEQSAYADTFISELMARFAHASGGTISFGVANSVEAAYLNLRRAKACGGGTFIETKLRNLEIEQQLRNS